VSERLYSIEQVADLLGSTPAHVWEWMQQGVLPYQRLPEGPLRVREKHVIHFLRERDAPEDTSAAPTESDAVDPPPVSDEVGGYDPQSFSSESEDPPAPQEILSEAERDALNSEDRTGPLKRWWQSRRRGEDAGDDAAGLQALLDLVRNERDRQGGEGDESDEDGRFDPEDTDAAAKAARSLEPASQTSAEPPAAEGFDAGPAAEGPPASAPQPAESRPAAVGALEGDEGPADEDPADEDPADEDPARIETPRSETPGESDGDQAAVAEPAAEEISAPDDLLRAALARSARQVHIRRDREGLSIRLRICGALIECEDLRPSLRNRTARDFLDELKARALREEEPDETRCQQGRFRLGVEGRELSCRLASTPISEGELAVVEFVSAGLQAPRDVHLSDDQLDALAELAELEDGLVLIAGPPRRGGRAVLWTLAGLCGRPSRHLLTICREPVVPLDAATHLPVERAAGPATATALEAAAGLDADVVVVSDLPEPAAARQAVAAAGEGHLILAAMSCAGIGPALERMLSMRVDSWTLSTALRAVVAVHPVGKLCEACKEPCAPDAEALEQLGLPSEEADFPVYRPVGCRACSWEGVRGRAALLSILHIDRPIAGALRRWNAWDIAQAMADPEQRSLREAVLQTLRAGTITLSEAARILS
jgi:type II secretory ATPase GspE/PulE/Tfp pilus assembly ATPase PilB-like protein